MHAPTAPETTHTTTSAPQPARNANPYCGELINITDLLHELHNTHNDDFYDNHYIPGGDAVIPEAIVNGTPITSLCGRTWHPTATTSRGDTHNPGSGICKACQMLAVLTDRYGHNL